MRDDIDLAGRRLTDLPQHPVAAIGHRHEPRRERYRFLHHAFWPAPGSLKTVCKVVTIGIRNSRSSTGVCPPACPPKMPNSS